MIMNIIVINDNMSIVDNVIVIVLFYSSRPNAEVVACVLVLGKSGSRQQFPQLFHKPALCHGLAPLTLEEQSWCRATDSQVAEHCRDRAEG